MQCVVYSVLSSDIITVLNLSQAFLRHLGHMMDQTATYFDMDGCQHFLERLDLEIQFKR